MTPVDFHVLDRRQHERSEQCAAAQQAVMHDVFWHL